MAMEENKYYMPNIEEFHVGFEFEELSGVDSTGIEDWSKYIIEDKYMLREVLASELTSVVRVKYLDKDDIEKLGFEFSKADEKTYLLHYTKGRVVLAFMDVSTTEWIEIYNAKSYDPNGPRIFKGCIKNKSELKQVLKMLGINED